MASRQRYRKLSLGPSDRITARASLTGLVVIADYVSTEDNQRYLVLERPQPTVTAKPPVARKPKRKAKASGGVASVAPTAIPAVAEA